MIIQSKDAKQTLVIPNSTTEKGELFIGLIADLSPHMLLTKNQIVALRNHLNGILDRMNNERH